jgi:hypothetical protein
MLLIGVAMVISSVVMSCYEEKAEKNNPVVIKIQELMTQALEEGDFDKYDELKLRLKKFNK